MSETTARFVGAYPADWKVIADAAKTAAGWACIRCGHPAGDGADPAGYRDGQRCTAACSHPRNGKKRTLTVHHLDGDKANAAWWNLLALCQACHLSVQSRVIPDRPWLLEHSAWFIPYVCGFYAAQAGLTITRAEAESDPDRFLALGQPWRSPTPQPPQP